MSPATERVAALFEESGFRGTCRDAALQLDMSLATTYKAINDLRAARRIMVVEQRKPCRNIVYVFAATSVAVRQPDDCGGNVSILASALATRHPLQLWACGGQP